MYQIIISEKAENQLKKLDKQIQKRIISILERIRINPEHYVVKLVGEQGYKLRVGDYRVFLDIDKKNLLILIIKIGHRKKIYKN